MTEWKEVNPAVWKPSAPGDAVEGTLIIKEESKGAYKGMRYTLDTTEQGIITLFGTTVLDERMRAVKVGDKIRIEYKGSKEGKKGMSPTKIFAVYKDAEQKAEA